ncbi:N-acetyltransferase [Robiginitalea sp. SC105]|uniref:GNAT family N-acetyltransferase n=1 Tax=Robiginitalea sp. SC105 TaxID=2762332 RepID=UPI00163A64F7|nr:GNAT family N-acetyltransferase [Robiginitalea sp. SC105]MBC2839701.1 GNAT family N-acetyltransferase [Robiginitalea sp. SC105]
MKALTLTDWTGSPEKFFRELPDDWSGDLRAMWPEIADGSRILVSADKSGFRCGGIVSRALFPDMAGYASQAQAFYRKQYWYIGYLYVHPDYRSDGLGTRWLEAVRKEVPARGFWLVIEKIGLLKFYTRSGFHVHEILHDGKRREWLLAGAREDW